VRKLLRSIAHANMARIGVRRPNKPKFDLKGRKQPSFFAENWRKYI
jgi:hypothetical protein